MADVKISELTALTSPDGAEELVVNDGGTTKKITLNNLFNKSIDVTGTVTADGLEVNTGTSNVVAKFVSTDSYALIEFEDSGTSTEMTLGAKDGDMVFRVNAAERMRIDSAGKVGINDTAPSSLLQITQTSDTTGGGFQIRNTADSNSIYIYQDGSDTTYDAGSSGDQLFKTGSAERMRIDSSGNVLVGKISTGYNDGIELNNGDYARINRDSGTALYVGRNSTDGEIVSFRKDGTTVGSIGAAPSNRFYIGSGDTGLRFSGDTNQIVPWNTTTNSVVNSAIDLGYSGGKFKDAYLSGGVYLGGVGSSNKLDDYEEGTWTPVARSGITITSGTATFIGGYTKIGNKVFFTLTASGTFTAAFSANANFSGLPFQVATIDTGLIHDASGGEKSITEIYSNERIYVLDSLGSSIGANLVSSGSYKTT